ncbi:MAG TPA: CRISPR-associated helicase Cas3' [Ktedonobacteraceae bacterium]|nr:CRISPR-associated helicase Cas3' [Ktedonobacteraceae bacterium]
MKSIAHTKNSQGKQQGLEEHLRNVADATSQYCASFGGAQFGYQAGLVHDIGKYDPAFQQYLLNAEQNPTKRVKGPDHKGAGTVLAETFERKGALSGIIYGHHGGIPSSAKLQTQIREHRMRKPAQEAIDKAKRMVPELLVPPGKILPAYIRSKLELDFFTRMAFSALVDADFLDTEQHFNAGKRPERDNVWNIADLWKTFETSYERKFAGAERNPLNAIRAEVYQSCLNAASLSPGFFRLTVPTGGGKTLASLGFALKHAKEHDLDRVIYAIPYTSIIDQTAQVFREIFGDDQAFIEHHSNISLPDSEYPIPAEIHRRFAAENWDAPLIATTTVQLFESLMGHGTSKCRKLHNIAKSVIVLDEAQMLPVYFLTPILDMLRQLVAYYGVTVVLCTATQPDLESRLGFEGLPDIREIVAEPERYFAQLKRVEYQLPEVDETWTWERIASRVQDERQILVIVNTRRDATELMDILTPDDEDDTSLFHLSTRLCSAHRKAVLEEVRRRLKDNEPCRLISTQVIEAGVDVDFPLVMRAIGPLDSIVQAAGRANREGKRSSGIVIVFAPENGHTPKGSYLVGTDIAGRLLKNGEADLHDPTLYQRYFREYYDYPYRDRYSIQELRESFDYPEVAQTFRMIEDDSTPVIVKYKPAAETVKKLLDAVRSSIHLRRNDLRALQPYTVNLLKHEFERAKKDSLVLEVIPDLWEWHGIYDSGQDGKHGQGIVLDSTLSADIHIW